MKKKPTISKLKKRLDGVFSLWIRNRDSGICFTCGKQGEIKEMQNGHFCSRVHMSLQYDEKNCHCQCVGCNIFKDGAKDEYAAKIIQTYGQEVLFDLLRRKHDIKRFTIPELEELIKKYALDKGRQ